MGRDGLAWHKLKRFQLLLQMIDKSMENISSLKSKQDAMNEEVKVKIEEFENSLQKLRQHKFQFIEDNNNFGWMKMANYGKNGRLKKKKKRLRLQAIGDDFVMAFQDLRRDFRTKFRNIVPIGPISNYNQIISNQQQQQTMNTTTTNSTETSPDAKKQKAAETKTSTKKKKETKK